MASVETDAGRDEDPADIYATLRARLEKEKDLCASGLTLLAHEAQVLLELQSAVETGCLNADATVGVFEQLARLKAANKEQGRTIVKLGADAEIALSDLIRISGIVERLISSSSPDPGPTPSAPRILATPHQRLIFWTLLTRGLNEYERVAEVRLKGFNDYLARLELRVQIFRRIEEAQAGSRA